MKYFYYSLIFFIAVLLVLIFAVILDRVRHGIGKKVIHTCLYLIEATVVTTILIYLLGISSEEAKKFEMARNYVFCFTCYQLILTFTLKIYDSLKIDSFTAIKTKLESYLIYVELEKKIPKEMLTSDTEKINNNEVYFIEAHRSLLLKIIQICELYNRNKYRNKDFKFELKQTIREVDHEIKQYSFAWTNSILLRWLK